MTIAGLGVVLETGFPQTEASASIFIDWTLDRALGDKKRQFSDYILLTTVGLPHEFMCHALEDPERKGKQELQAAPNRGYLHGWMSYVQLADLRDWARRGTERLRQSRKKAAQHGEIEERGNVAGHEQVGWRAAREWYQALHASFDANRQSKLRIPETCRYRSPCGVTVYSVLHVLTRRAVRKKDGRVEFICDYSRNRLSPGGACHRIDTVGRSLRMNKATADKVADLIAKAETVLNLDLSDWK